MPRVLFLVNLLERGVYTCHARVSFASARELQEFLSRGSVREKDGWGVRIMKGPSRGYDGKPLYQADIWLSSSLPFPAQSVPRSSQEMADFIVSDSGPQGTYGTDATAPEQTPEARSSTLTWEERAALQKASKALLQQLGVPCLGRRKQTL
jgi:hypothetical protein